MQSFPFDLCSHIDHSMSWVLKVDRQWRYTFLNDHTNNTLNSSDLIGKNCWEMFPESVNSPFYMACMKATREQTLITFEECVHPIGRWLEFFLYPSDEGLTILFTDITERKQREETWRNSEEKLDKINREMSALYNASQRLQKLLSPDQLSQEIISVLESLLDYTYSAVLLIDEADGVLLKPFALSLQKKGKEFLETDKEYIKSKGIRVGVGITGWVAEHGESVRIGDVLSDPRYFAMRQDLHSELCVPLLLQDRIIGVVNVESTRENAYSEDDQRLLETIAAQIAISIQNSRLFENIRAHAHELETIQAVSQSLISSLDSTVIIRSTLEKLWHLYKASLAGYFLLNPATQKVTLEHLVGDRLEGSMNGVEVPFDQSTLDLITVGQTILVKNAGEDKFSNTMVTRFPALAQATVMFAPITTEVKAPGSSFRKVTGFLVVLKTQPPAYNPSDLNILQSIASVLSVSIQNAQLFENLETVFTERERAQHLLVQSEKIAAFGKLAASLAHEINNPLQSVKGCLTLFQEEMGDGQDKAKLSQYMDIITSEIERIVRLVRRMREFYRPSPVQIQPVDIHEVLENVLALTSKEFSNKHIDVKTNLVPGLERIIGNPDHFKQLFINLILNAIEAMQDGGVLKITMDLKNRRNGKHLLGRSYEPELSIRFSDNGCGIPAEALSHLFEPFFTTKGTGSGLGLYVCAGIVESYGGKITVASRPNEGTIFTILLPYHPEVITE